MQIKHNDLIINQEAPFANCKLDREKYAHVLTSIVNNYADGFVLAINNEWGTGKTTFVKMWQKHLAKNDFETLYFNAWENDFESNPLVAILAELKTLTGDHDKTKFKSLLKKGAVLTKNVLPAFAKAMLDRYVDNKILLDGIEDATKATTEILEKEVESYATRKRSLEEFRKQLEEYLQDTESKKPVVFFIDELDRCRPSYAVEVLEQMKHFFAVPGIVFVLAIDKIQLGHAVRGIYGSEQLNADEYLRRFIDIEYSIPQPDTKQFCNYLFKYFSFADFFDTEERQSYGDTSRDSEAFISIASSLFDKKKITLRQQEKIFAHSRLALKMFKPNSYLLPNLFLFLTYINSLNKDFYRKIQSKQLSLQQLTDEFNQVIPDGLNEDEAHDFMYLQASLLVTYSSSQKPYSGKETLMTGKAGIDEKPVIPSKFDKSENNQLYASILKSVMNNRMSRTPIDHLLKKIDLIEPIIA